MKDNEVMEEVKEVMKRAKAKKDTEKEKEKEKGVSTDLHSCDTCREKIKGTQTSVKGVNYGFTRNVHSSQWGQKPEETKILSYVNPARSWKITIMMIKIREPEMIMKTEMKMKI